MLKIGFILFLLSPVTLVAQSDIQAWFIENKGQWDQSVMFAAPVPGGLLKLHDDHLSYSISNKESFSHQHHSTGSRRLEENFEVVEIEVKFTGANAQPTISYEHPSRETYNYYLGNNTSKWGVGCKAYATVTYHDLYPNIDLKFYYEGQSMKYDLVVKPKADPSLIQLQYHGDVKLSLEDGCVHIQSNINTITENKPVTYQLSSNGSQHPIQSNFRLSGNTINFDIDQFDTDKPLIIDPELIFSTFSGSVSDNFGFTACFDDEGSLYSGGIVFGPNFQDTNGSSFGGGRSDMAILKYDSTGSYLEYATFIGGNSEDAPLSLVVNNNNELVILGTTGSDNYPVTDNAYDTTFNGGTPFSIFGTYHNGSDIVLTKLGPTGNILASTYIGGAGNDGILKMIAQENYDNSLIQNYGDYMRGDVIMDADDNVYVASSTDTGSFPITSNIQGTYGGGNSDGVVFSLNKDFSVLRWSTFLGGTGDDAAFSIKLDTLNKVYVGGGTASDNFPVTPGTLNTTYQGEIDGFITKIDPVGDSILQSTYLGTPAYDQAYFIDIDEFQHVFAFGQTRGEYPVTSGTYHNPNSSQFIHKLTNNLDSTIFSTVFGSGSSEPNISPTAFLANECGNIFLSGWGGVVNYPPNGKTYGNTHGMPITSDALFPSTDGSDFYVMVLSSDGKELLYSTYFGGTDTDNGDHVDGGTSRFDKRGIIYQAVCSCGGADDDFPTTPNAWSTINRGVISDGTGGTIDRCNNAAFKFDLASLKARFETYREDLTDPGYNSGCIPLTVFFTNTSIGGVELLWTIDDGSERTSEDFFYTFENTGTYRVTLRVTDLNTCQTVDETSKFIYAYDDQTAISEDVTICRNENTVLHASGGISYEWEPADGLNSTTTPNPVASPDSTTTYTAKIITPNGCPFEEEVTVQVIPETVEEFEVIRGNSCNGNPMYTFINQTESEAPFQWDFGDGGTSTDSVISHSYAKGGEYFASLAIDDVCVVDKTVSIFYERTFIPNVFTPNGDDINDEFVITTDLTMGLEIFDRNGKSLYKNEVYANDWDGGNLPADVYYYSLQLADDDICNGWVQILK